MMLATALRFAAVHLLRDWQRSLLTTLSVAVMVCIYFLTAMLADGLKRFGAELISFPQILLMMSADSLFLTDSRLTTLDLNTVVDAHHSESDSGGIAAFSPLIVRQVLAAENYYTLIALTQEDMQALFGLSLITGDWPVVQQVVVSESFASITGLGTGARISVYGSEFTISGVVRSDQWTIAVVYMPYEQAQRLYAAGDVFQIGVLQLNPGADAQLIWRHLQYAPENQQYTFYLEDQLKALIFQTVASIQNMAVLVGMIALLIISFGAFNAATLLLMEHSREITLLRVVGFEAMHIRWLLFLRTTILMLAGFLMGCGLASGVTRVLQAGQAVAISGSILDLQVSLSTFGIGVILVLCSSILGVWLASMHLKHKSISAALLYFSRGRVG
jgi:ABC-type lipoprotein release transport system permease subunit